MNVNIMMTKAKIRRDKYQRVIDYYPDGKAEEIPDTTLEETDCQWTCKWGKWWATWPEM